MTNRPPQNAAAPIIAGLLAWLVPGAGHVYLGKGLRGVLLCACIHGLFWAGMAFGGVFTVEPLSQKAWFLGQMATGISGVGSWYRQDRLRNQILTELNLPARPNDPQYLRQYARDPQQGVRNWISTYEAELAQRNLALKHPTDSVARAYTGIAGMLNLLCIFDAVALAVMGCVGEPGPSRKSLPEAS